MSNLLKQRPASNRYWTKKRVLEGLRRAARDVWKDDPDALPSSTQAYTEAVNELEPIFGGRGRRVYPGPKVIFNYFESMNHAWYAAGFLVETKVRRRMAQIITPEIDARLRDLYSYGRKGGKMPPGVPTVKAYAEAIGVPAHLLSQRAAKLGLVTPKEKPWTNAELRLLEKFAHLSPTLIWQRFREKGYKRTELAIRLMRKRRGAHKGSPYYSVNALAILLGVDAHQFDRFWLKQYPDELKFEMKGTARGRSLKQTHGDTKLIHVNTIREFILNHPEEIDLHKVDKMWFLWLVTKGRVKLVASERLSRRAEGHQPQFAREHRGARKNSPEQKRKGAAAA